MTKEEWKEKRETCPSYFLKEFVTENPISHYNVKHCSWGKDLCMYSSCPFVFWMKDDIPVTISPDCINNIGEI